jgi:hypothetical protein
VSLKPAVEQAINELRAQFEPEAVSFVEDGQGGANVRVIAPSLPEPYNNPVWLGFHVSYTYPVAEIYPIFSRPDLRTDDFKNDAVSKTTWNDQPVTQLSLRIHKRTYDQAIETAVGKVLKIIQWLKDPQ